MNTTHENVGANTSNQNYGTDQNNGADATKNMVTSNSIPQTQNWRCVTFDGFYHGPQLSDDDKKETTNWLLVKQMNEKLPHRAINQDTTVFKVSRITLSKILTKILTSTRIICVNHK